jgi:integrase
MAKRGHGEGSIYQRKDGRWAASITFENRKRKTFYGKTRKEVQDKLNVALHEQQQGTFVTGSQQTLKQYLDSWLEEVHKPSIRISTYVKYRSMLDGHIIPALGHIKLQKLTAQQVQKFYTEKLKEGLSAKTVSLLHGLLHHALDNAVRWNLVPRNVCDLVSLPQAKRYDVQSLTPEQAKRLLEAVRGHRLEGILTLALTTGMRRGELLALRWQDIDFQDKSLRIRHTVDRITGHGYVENEPKTPTSRRKIVLPNFVIDVLKQHRAYQLEARLKAGVAWQDKDLVFCNTHGGYLSPDYLLEVFQKLLEDAGLPYIRFHDLRHSAATILLSMGVHPKVVQELLGHSKVGITLDIYSHVLPSMQRIAMDGMDELFGEQS